MSGRVFLDTNVLIYADDVDSGAKCEVARKVIAHHLRNGTGVISTQVLQEYFVVSTRKLGIDPAVAEKKVKLLGAFEVVAIRIEMIHEAIHLHRLESVSFWDALIVTAAQTANCQKLMSEDLNSGQKIRGIEIYNPFD
ncbi:PIN domain-containing protein [Microvenator marinus]|uniref:PIN domain-containing protein n=1 Tax=Microvenator marinus TaxID=2600177 RepID=A0A5B8XQJ6_9DELT|nr:PIN domain-containing protein [Microvenator marinus]QED28162.1 PIN domain-containing protein [Microvenator marinus]